MTITRLFHLYSYRAGYTPSLRPFSLHLFLSLFSLIYAVKDYNGVGRRYTGASRQVQMEGPPESAAAYTAQSEAAAPHTPQDAPSAYTPQPAVPLPAAAVAAPAYTPEPAASGAAYTPQPPAASGSSDPSAVPPTPLAFSPIPTSPTPLSPLTVCVQLCPAFIAAVYAGYYRCCWCCCCGWLLHTVGLSAQTVNPTMRHLRCLLQPPPPPTCRPNYLSPPAAAAAAAVGGGGGAAAAVEGGGAAAAAAMPVPAAAEATAQVTAEGDPIAALMSARESREAAALLLEKLQAGTAAAAFAAGVAIPVWQRGETFIRV